MIELSNLRLENGTEWTKLVCDVKVTEIENPFQESTMWFAVKNENAEMFSTETYDPFFLVPLYLCMHYGTNLKIKGDVSRKLYRNMIYYGQRILCNFSPALRPVEVSIDGFCGSMTNEGDVIGTGISCGIDSLSTIYSRFVMEKDPDYRINALFLFNCGTHGDYEEAETREKYLARYERNRVAAVEMGLPIYLVDSNLHAFTHRISEQKVGYFAIQSCIMSLQKVIRRYYISSTYEYNQIMEFGRQTHDFDMAEFADSYLVPLVQTEQMELILEGAQYTRSEKTQLIADWDIAKRYLNVCVAKTADTANCSKCEKCMRTMIPLDALRKLEDFADVFDLAVYHKNVYVNKLKILSQYRKYGFAKDNVDFARKNRLKMPSVMEVLLFRTAWIMKHNIRRLLGKH